MNEIKNCPGEPKSLSHRLVKLYLKIGRLHRDILDKEVRQTGVYRSQHHILMYLASNPDASQKEIARFQEVSTATIAVSLKKLEKAGYIKREVDQADNRCNRIQLTEKGEKIVTQSHEIFYRVEDEMFRGFDEGELLVLEEYFRRIYQNMKQSMKQDMKQK